MTTTSNLNVHPIFVLAMIFAACFTIGAPSSQAQIRTKKPDRGVYQPGGSTIYPHASSNTSATSSRSQTASGASWDSNALTDPESHETEFDDASSDLVQPVRIEPLRMRELPSSRQNSESDPSRTPRLHQVNNPRSVQLDSINDPSSDEVGRNRARIAEPSGRSNSIRRVSLETPIHPTPRIANSTAGVTGSRVWVPNHGPRHQSIQEEEIYVQHGCIGNGCVGASFEGEIYDQGVGCQCDGYGCDACGYDMGGYGACDGMGCDGCGFGGQRCANGSLCFDPCRWFASMEVLLLWRKGDFIPALVTSSPNGTLVDGAGELPGATVLAGQQKLFDDLTAGGRFTLGTWIDDCHNRSVVARLWSATEADYSFSGRESINSGGILAIPTTNGGVADTALIAFPDSAENSGRFGSVSVSAESNVAGGDVSVRQFWKGGLGTTFDVLYGYQYMRLDEELRLSSSSTFSQQQLPTEIGDNLTTSDSFDTTNEFHGGQFGMAGRYREGCWSFDFLAKFGFGQIRRKAERRGSSVITTGTPPAASSDTGILVTQDNRGVFSDDTFGWIPELDISLGWHKYPRFDVTFGYNLIAMTDAIRLSGAMDPDNNVDNPRVGFTEDTFYLQGLHFGIRHVY